MCEDAGNRQAGDKGHPAAGVDTGTAAVRKGPQVDRGQAAADIHSQQDYWPGTDKLVEVAAHTGMDKLVGVAEAAVRRGLLAFDSVCHTPPVSRS